MDSQTKTPERAIPGRFRCWKLDFSSKPFLSVNHIVISVFLHCVWKYILRWFGDSERFAFRGERESDVREQLAWIQISFNPLRSPVGNIIAILHNIKLSGVHRRRYMRYLNKNSRYYLYLPDPSPICCVESKCLWNGTEVRGTGKPSNSIEFHHLRQMSESIQCRNIVWVWLF